MIAIIDYGGGNIQSVYKALKYIDRECKITNDKNEILGADAAILPGQGSFGDCMNSITKSGLNKTVLEFINSGKPFLGICVGLQLLFEESEESPEVKGLGVFKGKIKRIPNKTGLKIPHMGWNSVKVLKNDALFKDVDEDSYFYFVHSYYLDAKDKGIVSTQTEYGVTIDASVSCNNVFATQFHPEKSGDAGIKLLRNFVSIAENGQ